MNISLTASYGPYLPLNQLRPASQEVNLMQCFKVEILLHCVIMLGQSTDNLNRVGGHFPKR